ncbi:MAG: hypothetical protein V4695_00580 [Pseudomonadota bacterium]
MMIGMMIVDDHTAKERTWAIPAICALIILHHDFPVPRLARIRRLAWSEAGLEITFQYGTCNVSGNVLEATDFLVTLHRDGAVGVTVKDERATGAKVAMVRFLAGEIARETRRWSEDLIPWAETDPALPQERAAVLNIVSALVAYPVNAFDVEVAKQLHNRARVSKVRIVGDTALMEITSAGTRSASLYVQPLTKQSDTVRSYKKYDIPVVGTWRKPPHARLMNKVSCSTIRLALLPVDFMIYLCEKAQKHPSRAGTAHSPAKPAQVIDANAGDNLSALFN